MPPSERSCPFDETMTRLKEEMKAALSEGADVLSLNGAKFERIEQAVHRLGRQWADEMIALWLRGVCEDSTLQQEAREAKLQANPGAWRSDGRAEVEVQLLGGKRVRLPVLKVRRRRQGPGRPRRPGHRGTSCGSASAPVLEVLGFMHHMSPALARRLTWLTTACESFESARAILADTGVALTSPAHWRRFQHVAADVREQHQRWLDGDSDDDSPVIDFKIKGQVVAIAFDGGRCRQRIAKRGRRRLTGYHGFDAPWIEPRQIVVYLLDQRGKKAKYLRAVACAWLADADECQVEIEKLLRALHLEEASHVVLLGDGARWQWERLTTVLDHLGVQASRRTEVLDQPHALSHLEELSHLHGTWSEHERRAWFKSAKRLLIAGQIDRLIERCQRLATGSWATKVTASLEYFRFHRQRMRYNVFKAHHRPLGSGVVESLIRQVINARLKSCGKFWLPEHMRHMLLLRSWLKTGRFHDLFDFALRRSAAWWSPCSHAANDDGLSLHQRAS